MVNPDGHKEVTVQSLPSAKSFLFTRGGFFCPGAIFVVKRNVMLNTFFHLKHIFHLWSGLKQPGVTLVRPSGSGPIKSRLARLFCNPKRRRGQKTTVERWAADKWG